MKTRTKDEEGKPKGEEKRWGKFYEINTYKKIENNEFAVLISRLEKQDIMAKKKKERLEFWEKSEREIERERVREEGTE